MERNAKPQEFAEALHGLDFPASLSGVQNKVKDKGGLNREVIWIIDHLPDRVYHSMDEVTAEIERAYDAFGPLVGGGPAASPASVKGKRAAGAGDTGGEAAPEQSQSGTE